MRTAAAILVLLTVSAAQTVETGRQYSTGYDNAWAATMQGLAALGFTVKSAEKVSGTIFLEESKSFGGLAHATFLVGKAEEACPVQTSTLWPGNPKLFPIQP